MGHVPMLPQLVVIVVVGVLASILLARLRLPSAAGLLLAGALVGPSGLGLVDDGHEIEILAEVGVVLLLFTIGLELSLERFMRIARLVAIGGALQVGLTGAAAYGISVALDFSSGTAVFYGFVFALSSTAIVLRGLSERGETDAPHGRFIVGVLIFQDLCVVPMVLIVPILGGAAEGGVIVPLGIALGKAVLVVTGTLVVSRFLVPRFFRLVETARSREVFLLTVLGICIGTAWLTSLAGLSLALGAFLGGMVVAGTEHGHRAMAEVLPLRDAFTSVFFVSMGMLFDVRVVAAAPLVVVLLLVAFILGKALLAILAAMAMRFPGRVAILAGVGLAQFSEFSFVLARLGIDHQVVKEAEIQPVLAAGILSMFLTPVLLKLAPHISAGERLLRPLERLLGARSIDDADAGGELAGHVIIVGYGVGGRLLARALRESEISYVILELNAETVRKASKEGENIYYADVTSPEALEHAHVKEAKAVVLMINDVQACRRGAAAVRHIAPDVPVVARTRYLMEGTILAPLATDVVYEEVEAGVEVLARVLRVFDLPRNLIGERIEAARRETQASARPLAVPRRLLGEVTELSDLKIEKVLLRAGSHAIGRTLKELAVRQETGALIVALRRSESLIDSPDADQPLVEDDIVYLVGQTDAVILACRILIEGRATHPPPSPVPATE